MKISHHLDDEMLMRYSAGTLAEGWSLGVATHLSLCRVCRSRLAAFNSMGGYLLEIEEGQTNLDAGWEAMKQRLTAVERDSVVPLMRREPAEGIFPYPLGAYVRKAGGLKWRGLGVGAAQMVIPTGDPTTIVRLLKVPAGKPVPEHSHGGTELTLVLDGSFSDEISTFHRGDVENADETVQHTPRAHPEKDCICLAVTDAPLKFKSRLMKILQPLIGI